MLKRREERIGQDLTIQKLLKEHKFKWSWTSNIFERWIIQEGRFFWIPAVCCKNWKQITEALLYISYWQHSAAPTKHPCLCPCQSKRMLHEKSQGQSLVLIFSDRLFFCFLQSYFLQILIYWICIRYALL